MTDQIVSLSYWQVTKNIYYSLLFVFPMLFLYEIMCWIQFAGSSIEIRNGADVFLRQLIMGNGRLSESIYGLILIIIVLYIMFINRNIVNKGYVKFTFLLYMFAESLLWCLGFIILMSICSGFLVILKFQSKSVICLGF